MNVDRQTVMMPTNLLIGALGGLALAFFFYDVTTAMDALRGMVPCAVVFSIVSLVLQTARALRLLGILLAYMFFTAGVITLYVLVQQIYPGLLPMQIVDETAQTVVRAMIALAGVLVAIAWAKVNPYTPVPAITLTLTRR